MGVISNGSNPFSGFIEDAPYNIADLDPVLHEDVEAVDGFDVAIAEPRRTRKVKARAPVKPMNFASCHKQAGIKKCRRYENSVQLMGLANSDELDELTIDDFVAQGVSAFSQLLQKPENLKLWNDFVNCSEEQQTQILMKELADCGCSEETKQSSSTIEDQRTGYPSFNADECFRKIGNRCRALLKKKHLPLGTLAQIEVEVTSFFTEWPREIYISMLPSGYDRLLLHALCQYLNLVSRSVVEKGRRQTRVMNPREVFQLPEVLLTQYIEQRFRMQ